MSLLACALGSLVFCGIARFLARRLRFLDRPGSEAHKQQATAVPYGGGAAMMLALGLGCVCAVLLGDLTAELLRGKASLMLAAAGLFLLGLVDDLRHLPARAKLLVQTLLVVGGLYPSGLRIESLDFLPGLDIAAAVIWCVLITNAYNLLDHADGLSSSVALTTCIVLLITALLGNDPHTGLLIGLLMSALLGFLWWNRPPARLYMGDAGALPLGFLLGVGALQVTFWESDSGHGSQLAVLSPLLLTAIPIYTPRWWWSNVCAVTGR
jgi:UDP-GlcNAc:undecaprenyl-phosphate GlcNAc-1-phosphate transferase